MGKAHSVHHQASSLLRMSVAFSNAINQRKVGEKAAVDVFETTGHQLLTTIFDDRFMSDELLAEIHYTGPRWTNWSSEILGVGEIPRDTHVCCE